MGDRRGRPLAVWTDHLSCLSHEGMALDSKATPEERFSAWLAQQAPFPDQPPRPRHVRLPLRIRALAFVVGLALWVALLWSLGAQIRQLLHLLKA